MDQLRSGQSCIPESLLSPVIDYGISKVAKFCPYCGKQLGDRSKFCPVCGKAAPERKKTGVLTGDLAGTPAETYRNRPAHGARQTTESPLNSAGLADEAGFATGSPAGGPRPEDRNGAAAAATPGARVTEARPARPVTTRVAGGRARLYAPPTHAFLGAFEQAGFGLRYGAWMFDFLIILIAMMSFTFLVTAVSHKSVVGSNSDLVIVAGLTLLLFLLNFVLLAGLNGQSAGMRILGIRIARVDGKPFKIRHALVRHIIGYPISMAVFFLGFLWMLWDPRQQAWHDKLAKTIVVMR